MVKPYYYAYVHTSVAVWESPKKEAFLTWAAVFIPEEQHWDMISSLSWIVGRRDQVMNSYQNRGPESSVSVRKLSDTLSRVTYVAESIPLQGPNAVTDDHRASIVKRVDAEIGAFGARGEIRTDAQLLFLGWANLDRIAGINPDAPGLVLADFAAWANVVATRGQTVYQHFRGELLDFQAWVERYPSLAAAHPIGNQLSGALDSAPVLRIEEDVYVRAREVKESRIFTVDDMSAPPSEKVVTEGRFNHVGMPVLYLASDEATCAAEIVRDSSAKLVWVQRFRITGKRILDLTVAPDVRTEPHLGDMGLLIAALVHEGTVSRPLDHGHVFKPEYYVPRYVADLARAYEVFDGIRYSSTKGTGYNLALFNWSEGVTALGNPTIRVYAEQTIKKAGPSRIRKSVTGEAL